MPSGSALVLVPLLWAVVVVGWAPMLFSDRIRTLCSRWPTGRLAVDYPLLVGVVVAGHVAAFLAVGIQIPAGSPMLPAWAFASALLVPAVAWVIVAVGLPATHDVDLPDGVWLPLAVGAVWYAVVVGVAFAVIALVMFALFFPG